LSREQGAQECDATMLKCRSGAGFNKTPNGIVFVDYAHWWINFSFRNAYLFRNHYELRKSMIIFAGGLRMVLNYPFATPSEL
jgi:hypothetical protein